MASVAGGAIKSFVNPTSMYGIAKSGLRGHLSFWKHADLIAEVNRRGLTPLPKQIDESMGVLMAGQMVGLAAGETIGGFVSDAVVGPAMKGLASAAGMSLVESAAVNLVRDEVTDHFVGHAVEQAVQTPATNAIAGAVPEKLKPDPNTSKLRYKAPLLSFLRRPNTGPAYVTDHLKGIWEGWAAEAIQFSNNSPSELNQASSPTPPARPPRDPPSSTSTRPPTPSVAAATSSTLADFSVPMYRMKIELAIEAMNVTAKNHVDTASNIIGRYHLD
jgi:hypothetical protein